MNPSKARPMPTKTGDRGLKGWARARNGTTMAASGAPTRQASVQRVREHGDQPRRKSRSEQFLVRMSLVQAGWWRCVGHGRQWGVSGGNTGGPRGGTTRERTASAKKAVQAQVAEAAPNGGRGGVLSGWRGRDSGSVRRAAECSGLGLGKPIA
jgi:hypothetical protein